MSNPFEYIKTERALKAEREAQEKTRIENEEKLKIQRIEKLSAEFQPVVVQVLTNLRDAAYSTKDDIVKHSNLSGEKLKWSIGRYRGKQDEEYWVAWVDVVLEIESEFSTERFPVQTARSAKRVSRCSSLGNARQSFNGEPDIDFAESISIRQLTLVSLSNFRHVVDE